MTCRTGSRGWTSEPHTAFHRGADRAHQPRVRAARSVHAEPGAGVAAHADLREGLVIAVRRRRQPARRVHEQAARPVRDRGSPAVIQDGARRRLQAAMRSIGARLALWYAAASTATLACLFVVGYYLLRGYLIHGLDPPNQSEFQQIRAHLGTDYAALSPAVIDERIRETTDYASVLFYIDVHSHSGTIFYSSNLNGRAIPDIKGLRRYDVPWDSGPLRVGEFVMAPYDVIVATPEAQVEGVMEGYAEVSAALLARLLAMSTAIGFGLSNLALRPVRLIRATASRIG